MDLIYTDKNKKDVGALNASLFDMAFGKDENNFTVTVSRQDHCCEKKSYIYAEGEEYGGIVDQITVNTEDDTVAYSGRSWHGILNGKIIQPVGAHNIYSGDANEVIAEIIDSIDLSELFHASSQISGIDIINYQMPRYVEAYTGILAMLQEFGGKIKLLWNPKGYVEISAVPYADYSGDEFSGMLTDFKITKTYSTVNHIICLGQGELEERNVIHIFTDQDGNIQPYANVDVPLQDSDYILDESMKVLSEEDEITEKYEFSSVGTVNNYILQTEEPSDWEENAANYFTLGENDDESEEDTEATYESVKWITKEIYNILTTQPSDWEENYDDYFEIDEETGEYTEVDSVVVYEVQTSKPSNWDNFYDTYYSVDENGKYSAVSGIDKYTLTTSKPKKWSTQYGNYYEKSYDEYGEWEGDYSSVSGDTVETYTVTKSKPKNWDTYYGAYYTKYADGTGVVEYSGVSADSKDYYEKQTSKPSDWSSNYKSYYMKDKKGKYVAVAAVKKKAPTWTKNKYFTKKSKDVIPTWKSGKYYRKSEKETAPTWKSGKIYSKQTAAIIPTWKTNTYYTKIKEAPPTWTKGTYYEVESINTAPIWTENTYCTEVYDNYAAMIEEVIEKLEEYYNSDELEVDLTENDIVYDVGDVVGVIDEITGLTTTQPVTKKIIKMEQENVTITYEVD